MRQVIQYQKNGQLFVQDVPLPRLRSGGAIVRNTASLISAGTERTSIETAQASWVGKARSRPDLVKQVLDNVKREGVLATYRKVQSRLDNFKELGYSSAGVVVESSADGYSPGDRVACGGVGYASHAEYIFVPRNLMAQIPDGVPFEDASFATIAAVGMQGVRQADVRLGETVVVIGLGLLGMLVVQMLKAAGVRTIGLDISETNFALARTVGCDVCARSTPEAVSLIESLTRGLGADAVIIAAATLSNEPVELAVTVARKKGRVVILGRVGMDVPYLPFYSKELEIRQSCSYGPGRYDPLYEEEGVDYPAAYVRWTEQRNMQAALELMQQGRLKPGALITHRFPLDRALDAYAIVTGEKKEPYLGIMLSYPERVGTGGRTVQLHPSSASLAIKRPGVSFIGAGNFAQSYLLPHFSGQPAVLRGVVTSNGVSARSAGDKFRFQYCTTDVDEVLRDAETHAVCIATRHDSHAPMVIRGLSAGKHVFVEKPLALSLEALEEVAEAAHAASSRGVKLLVGFNRRFSSPLRDIRSFFERRAEPLVMLYRVNAGSLAASSWYLRKEQGGRLAGEICHFIDAVSFVAGSLPVRIAAEPARRLGGAPSGSEDVVVSLGFADGSVASILYLTGGNTGVEKEYFEAHAGGRSAVMENFTSVRFFKERTRRARRYDGGKGHAEEMAAFIRSITDGTPLPVSAEELLQVTRASLMITEAMQTGGTMHLGEYAAAVKGTEPGA